MRGVSFPRRRFFRPTWAEVDLGAIKRNLRAVRDRMPAGAKIMFVVKANAYGHDAALCARAAESGRDADWFGVSSVEEGMALREAGARLPVLVLGSLYLFTLIGLVTKLVSDLSYVWVDPRVRFD